ncbi:MAG: hypothetical protein HY321_20430 [Armatimonadetes bacterium]|nr:hypothetical protein [Armatimonadota bacterium]
MPPEFTLQVPKMVWPAIEYITDAPVEELERLASFIATAAPCSDVEDLGELCAEQTGVPAARADDVISLAIGLNRLQREFGRAPGEILGMVSRALERADFPGWGDARGRAWEERRGILERMLDADGTVEAMSKARQLLYEFQCILRDTMVITDTRHIYDRSGANLRGALVVHTLALQFSEGLEARQIHIALSADDIEKLVAQLTRAQKKAEAAVALLQQTGIPELTPKRSLEP